ncbi:MAG: ATP synthase F1 subunit delta [Gemmatimonadetes bacterium]|nr:ATP synthase F1 subunit delta [Gemmatimonadota bacterium]
MREPTIVRNYAETLVEIARRAGDLEGYGRMIDGVASAMRSDRTLRLFLESPGVDVGQKSEVIGKALAGRVPVPFVKYLQAVVRRRRQLLIPEIAVEYGLLVDAEVGRVHAAVTVSRATDDAERDRIAAALSRAIGKTVVPHLVVDPAILGGIVVKVGDTVMDGSVRRKLARLRQRMVHGTR